MREKVFLFFILVIASGFDTITTKTTILEPGAEEASPFIQAIITYLPASWHTLAIFTSGIVLPWVFYLYLVSGNSPNTATSFLHGIILVQILASINNLILISPEIDQTRIGFMLVYIIPSIIFGRGVYLDYQSRKKNDKNRELEFLLSKPD